MKEIFLWVPIETLIHEQQEAYYEVLNAANMDGEATIYVEFMLKIIKKALEDLTQSVIEDSKKGNSSVRDGILELLKTSDKEFYKLYVKNTSQYKLVIHMFFSFNGITFK